MDKKLKYFQVYDDIKTHYEKELAWQKGLLSTLRRKMKLDSYKEVDQELGDTLLEMYKENIGELKARLKEIEEIFEDSWKEQFVGIGRIAETIGVNELIDRLDVKIGSVDAPSVLKLRFGLIDGNTRTLEEVGKRYGVTRERIRQVEERAIKKMKRILKGK